MMVNTEMLIKGAMRRQELFGDTLDLFLRERFICYAFHFEGHADMPGPSSKDRAIHKAVIGHPSAQWF